MEEEDMPKVAIITDSNSGITQKQGHDLGIFVLPMPYMINDEPFFEDIDLTQEAFYARLEAGAEVVTSQPSPGNVTKMWDEALSKYDEVIHIPMSSGLSASCETATLLARDYGGKVQVVDNKRISVTQKQSTLDAIRLAGEGKSAAEIKEILLADSMNSSIYIMLNTLYYLKKGGRITPAAAALGSVLKIKPVLQIQGAKLDAFAKARTVAKAIKIMIKAVKDDMQDRFGGSDPENVKLYCVHSRNLTQAEVLKAELMENFPGIPIAIDNLSLSVACHIGPGSLAVACTKNLR
jgi:DegV family protein with EDD domain